MYIVKSAGWFNLILVNCSSNYLNLIILILRLIFRLVIVMVPTYINVKAEKSRPKISSCEVGRLTDKFTFPFQSFHLDTTSMAIATALKNTKEMKLPANSLQPAGRIMRGDSYGARFF